MTPSLIDAVRATLTDELDIDGPSRAVFISHVVSTLSPLLAAETERRARVEAALKEAYAALGAASSELWATYGETPRLRPLFDQIDAVPKIALTAGGPEQ